MILIMAAVFIVVVVGLCVISVVWSTFNKVTTSCSGVAKAVK